MEAEPSNNNNNVVLLCDEIQVTKEDKDTLKEWEYLPDSVISIAFALYERQNKQKISDRNIVVVFSKI